MEWDEPQSSGHRQDGSNNADGEESAVSPDEWEALLARRREGNAFKRVTRRRANGIAVIFVIVEGFSVRVVQEKSNTEQPANGTGENCRKKGPKPAKGPTERSFLADGTKLFGVSANGIRVVSVPL